MTGDAATELPPVNELRGELGVLLGYDLSVAVLALPSVRRLLADRQAVERVEALADSLDVDSCDPMPDERARLLFDTAQRIRRALGGAS